MQDITDAPDLEGSSSKVSLANLSLTAPVRGCRDIPNSKTVFLSSVWVYEDEDGDDDDDAADDRCFVQWSCAHR